MIPGLDKLPSTLAAVVTDDGEELIPIAELWELGSMHRNEMVISKSTLKTALVGSSCVQARLTRSAGLERLLGALDSSDGCDELSFEDFRRLCVEQEYGDDFYWAGSKLESSFRETVSHWDDIRCSVTPTMGEGWG